MKIAEKLSMANLKKAMMEMMTGLEKWQMDLKAEMKEVNEKLSLQIKMINNFKGTLNFLILQSDNIRKKMKPLRKK